MDLIDVPELLRKETSQLRLRLARGEKKTNDGRDWEEGNILSRR
jgi:hypothetical protein